MIFTEASLNDYQRASDYGSETHAIGDNLYGINHRRTPSFLPKTKKFQGFTFFTRPQLNLQTDNLANSSVWYPLLHKDPYSMQRYVRCMLDPRIIHGWGAIGTPLHSLECPIIDNKMAFIPPVTNNIVSATGWPEKVVPTFTSDETDFGATWSCVDGITDLYGKHDIDFTFDSHYGDPLMRVFSYLTQYQSDVRRGMLQPYPDMIVENVLDYTLGIYRLILDKSTNKVVDLVWVPKAIIQNDPTGRIFDFQNKAAYSEETNQFTIKMLCEGIRYNVPIIVHCFNSVVKIFNPDMEDDVRESKMMIIPPMYANYFRNRGYPRINPNDDSLEWWIDAVTGNQVLDAILSVVAPSDPEYFS